MKAKRFILNKEFEKSFFRNDIALIELENDIKFTDAIRPICLLNRNVYSNEFDENEDKNNFDLNNNLVQTNFAIEGK